MQPVGQNTFYLCACVRVCVFCYFLCEVASYHGRHHPADVYGAASVQVVLSSVLLVLGADLEQIQTGLQNTGFVLNTRWETKKKMRILDVMLINDPWLTCAPVTTRAYLSMRVSSLLPCALLKRSLEHKMNCKRLCCHLRFDTQNHLLMNTVFPVLLPFISISSI